MKKELSVPQQHQKKIAISTLKMSDAGAMIMGGMSKNEARTFLQSIGINPILYESPNIFICKIS